MADLMKGSKKCKKAELASETERLPKKAELASEKGSKKFRKKCAELASEKGCKKGRNKKAELTLEDKRCGKKAEKCAK